MLTINIKRSVGALAVTAGLLAAVVPASHAATEPRSSAKVEINDALITSVSSGKSDPGTAGFQTFDLQDAMISGVKAKTTKPSSVQLTQSSVSGKAKPTKGKRGKGKITHTYDIQSSNRV